ncbi:radical SAM protein [Caldisericum sp. AR60]|uniref:radical SAM protein n=1 Tax=Caldisericum sp. AR60 TaxID=3397852 RepID=UPI0039FC3964
MVFFFYPSRETLEVSLTGTACSLNCNHCNARYLSRMKTKEQILEILENHPGRFKSILISGGSTKDGKVPILEHMDFIKKVHSMGLKLNFHTGLLSEEEIRAIKPYVERISFDFVYDDRVIQEVYHLKDKTKEDFEKTYLLMRRIIGGRIENEEGLPQSRVVPHITLGIKCGEIDEGEEDTIDELAFIKPTLIVIDVFIPTKGTPFENCPVPDLDKVLKMVDKAYRRTSRTTTLFLGCMRPFGEYRELLDVEAYKLGVKGFVLPSKSLRDLLKEQGEEVRIFNECCALI